MQYMKSILDVNLILTDVIEKVTGLLNLLCAHRFFVSYSPLTHFRSINYAKISTTSIQRFRCDYYSFTRIPSEFSRTKATRNGACRNCIV